MWTRRKGEAVFGPLGGGGGIERPIARFPIIDAPAFEPRQPRRHGLAGGSDEIGPGSELLGAEQAALPDRAGRIDDQIAPVLAVDENQIGRGKDDVAALAGIQDLRTIHAEPGRNKGRAGGQRC